MLLCLVTHNLEVTKMFSDGLAFDNGFHFELYFQGRCNFISAFAN